MAKTIQNTSGIKIVYPDRFSEQYDRSLDVRKCGTDNVFFQHINDFYANSPTFNKCATRKKHCMFGQGSNSTLIDNKTLSAILTDYAKFNGFALHVNYNGLGDIVSVNYIPFETIRLGEQGTNGLYTYCYYCSDWSGIKTQNNKKIDPKRDKIRYWMFASDVETRLRRIEAAEGNYIGEVLYYSNTISYPVSPINAVLNYVSAEVGLANITYRDVRSNFLPAAVLSIPTQSDEDYNSFQNALTNLQGDENSYKVLLFEHSSEADKPEVLNLQGEDFISRYQSVIEDCSDKILGAYGQEAFKRLLDGSLGFGSDTIAEVYKFYNWSLAPERREIEVALQQLDRNFKIAEAVYQSTNIPSETNV